MDITSEQLIAANKIGDYFFGSLGLGQRIKLSAKATYFNHVTDIDIKAWTRSHVLVIENIFAGDRIGSYTTNYFIYPDGEVDVEGDVYFSKLDHKFKTLPIKFGEISGEFNCMQCGLETLKGGPHTVGESFDCRANRLQNLEGCPKTAKMFSCRNNILTSLKGSPQHVAYFFDCAHNRLTTLEGGPEWVGTDFDCSDNQLRNFKGKPKHIGGKFEYESNPLDQLMGIDSADDDIDQIVNGF